MDNPARRQTDRSFRNALGTGDSLTVWKLDRLGRSLRDLIIVLDDFKERGIKFRSLTENIDTETATGRAMWQMISVLAELERSQIKERTQAGIAAAKARGVQFGRKKKLKPYQVQRIRKRIRLGEAPSDVAESFNIGRSTLYRALAS
jgi:DNA invertase Pin-like site-specific DNA recombinase